MEILVYLFMSFQKVVSLPENFMGSCVFSGCALRRVPNSPDLAISSFDSSLESFFFFLKSCNLLFEGLFLDSEFLFRIRFLGQELLP
jgi:hypothetical protein